MGKCTKCCKEIKLGKEHHINYSGETLCDTCYSDDIKKEEDLFDYCQARGFKYVPPIEEEHEEELRNKSFYGL